MTQAENVTTTQPPIAPLIIAAAPKINQGIKTTKTPCHPPAYSKPPPLVMQDDNVNSSNKEEEGDNDHGAQPT